MSKKGKRVKTRLKPGDYCWVITSSPMQPPLRELGKVLVINEETNRIGVWCRDREIITKINAVIPYGGEND